MCQLLASPVLIPIVGTYNWRLGAPFVVQDSVLGKIEVAEGFITDLGSIPRLFWNLVPPEGPATPAYLIHDWLYSRQNCTRQQADDFLLRFMTVLRVNYFTRYVIYWNLRAFGWSAWNSDRKRT